MRKRTVLQSLAILALGVVLPFSFVSCDMANGGDYYYSMTDMEYYSPQGSEEYTEIIENPFVSADTESTSYFSIDANTASYPNIRSLLSSGATIPEDAVRIEEMLNYFEYDYKGPEGEDILALNASIFNTPYNKDTKLLTVGLAAEKVDMSGIRNNVVFLIDTSGSMESSDKLGLVQSAFKLMAENLGKDDRVSIVTYAGSDTVALSGAYGYETERIKAVISDLRASGSTAGAKGIERAYELASQFFIEGGNNRVILATDGDFNVGISDSAELEKFISKKRDTGIYFSVYGVGRGNLKSEKMETLALAGNGTYSYIDSVIEAKRAFVDAIGGSLITVAKDVKAGITFNSNYVDSYRLIGYENKLLTSEEFEDENTDAGELGSGHTVTVVYEIKLKGEGVIPADSLASVEIKYKPTENTDAQDTQERSLTLEVSGDAWHETPTDTDLFVASVIEFGLILRHSDYLADGNIDSLIERLESIDTSNYSDREGFIETVKLYRQNLQNDEQK